MLPGKRGAYCSLEKRGELGVREKGAYSLRKKWGMLPGEGDLLQLGERGPTAAWISRGMLPGRRLRTAVG